MRGECAILVFAKAPVAGHAKTRLIPSLGAHKAARLAQRMLDETLGQAVKADVGPVTLCCTPSVDQPAFAEAAQCYGVALISQGEGNLGARMHRAFAAALQKNAGAIVIGTDCPGLGAEHLRQAAQALQTGAAVFAPATDGGYVLAGLSMPMPLLFDSIAWSTDAVMAQTRARLAQLGVVATELPTMQDIDLPGDLVHVPQEWLT